MAGGRACAAAANPGIQSPANSAPKARCGGGQNAAIPGQSGREPAANGETGGVFDEFGNICSLIAAEMALVHTGS